MALRASGVRPRADFVRGLPERPGRPSKNRDGPCDLDRLGRVRGLGRERQASRLGRVPELDQALHRVALGPDRVHRERPGRDHHARCGRPAPGDDTPAWKGQWSQSFRPIAAWAVRAVQAVPQRARATAPASKEARKRGLQGPLPEVA